MTIFKKGNNVNEILILLLSTYTTCSIIQLYKDINKIVLIEINNTKISITNFNNNKNYKESI